MNLAQLQISDSVVRDLFSHIRGSQFVFDDASERLYALYDTTFNGSYWVEINLGRDCAIAIEHIINGAAGWVLDEYRYRLHNSRKATILHDDLKLALPKKETVQYQSDLVMVDQKNVRLLVDTILSLDWTETTPDSHGRDGIILSGGISTPTCCLEFTTWSPEFQFEPAKCEFFWVIWSFVKIFRSELSIDIEPVDSYLSQPNQTTT